MRFKFTKLKLRGLVLVEPEVGSDARGTFSEIYKSSVFSKAGIKETFVQDNRSVSQKGVLRGLHYQRRPFAQAKLVSCGRGRVLDVAVDLRRGSKTFKKWFGVELSGENRLSLFIPAGFAHGFLALEDGSELTYKCSKEYAPAYDAGIRWDDPAVGVKWPVKKPRLSEKDSNLPVLSAVKSRRIRQKVWRKER
ncbi:MAG TPA: dTDP-4-dehydrorhamnose 3,5-epimerase [Elusimicrobia bacterium]|nr:dTDP-4-dehydrorhamnose 3,5-epimerase [Elusimicrobiota bacterium]